MSTQQDYEEKLKSIEEAASYLRGSTSYTPSLAIVCGTGLGGLCDALEQAVVIPYDQIPHFPVSTVPGHAGKLVFGLLGGKQVVCMKGRVHAYEGHSMWKVTFYMRVFASLGIKVVMVTNASGALNGLLQVADVMIISDHINLPGMASHHNPLSGLNHPSFGARFQETTTAYDKELQQVAFQAAQDLSMSYVRSGVYMFQMGPAFESPAEVRMCRTFGADVVGMSTVPEVLVARHCGIRCLGLSLVTNKCVDNHLVSQKPEHAEVLEVGELRAKDLQRFVREVVQRINTE